MSASLTLAALYPVRAARRSASGRGRGSEHGGLGLTWGSGTRTGDGRATAQPDEPGPRARSFYLSRELVDRARAAVHATSSRPGESHNLSELAGRVLLAEVRRLEERYNAGRPFPPVQSVPPGPGPAGIERIRNGVARRGRS